jgi:hypothetical protein
MTQYDDQRGESTPWASLRMGGVAVALVLAVVAGRARAEHVKPHVPGEIGHLVFEVVDTIGITLLVAGLVLMMMGRRLRALKPKKGPGKRKRALTKMQRKRLVISFGIGLLVAAAYELLLGGGPPPKEQQPADQVEPGSQDTGQDQFGTKQGHGGHDGGIGTYLTVIAAVIALAVMVWVMLRRIVVDEEDEVEDEETPPETVAAAVAAGRAAVQDRTITDPREAIVACFAAMERALAGVGGDVAPREADTPAEVLRRGLEGASLPAPPARTLLRLFQEARFSRHPLDEDDRSDADRALSEILNSLDARIGSAR